MKNIKKMKRILTVLLCVVFLISGCGAKPAAKEGTDTQTVTEREDGAADQDRAVNEGGGTQTTEKESPEPAETESPEPAETESSEPVSTESPEPAAASETDLVEDSSDSWETDEVVQTAPEDVAVALEPDMIGEGLQAGMYVTYGSYEQDNNTENGAEPIEWVVAEVREGKVLLLSRYGLYTMSYNDQGGASVHWRDSTVRNWLNTEFFDTAFSAEEQTHIAESTIENAFNNYEIIQENTQDKVFLLSADELKDLKRSGVLMDLKTEGTDYAADIYGDTGWYNPGIYWLRSPEGNNILENGYASAVDAEGNIMETYWDINFCLVRPAVWVTEPEYKEIDYSQYSLALGKTVTIGRYEQDNVQLNGPEPIEWVVVDMVDSQIFLVSQYILDLKRGDYLSEWKEEFYEGAFDDEEKDYIVDCYAEIDSHNEKKYGLILGTGEYAFPTDYAKTISPADSNIYNTFCVDRSWPWWGITLKDPPRNQVNGVRPEIVVDLSIFDTPLVNREQEQNGQMGIFEVAEMQDEYFVFGRYEQDNNLENGPEPLEWVVLEEEEDRMLLTTRYCIDALEYDDEGTFIDTKSVIGDVSERREPVYWENCTLREWLNQTFLMDAFNDGERKFIPLSTIVTPNKDSNWRPGDGPDDYEKTEGFEWAGYRFEDEVTEDYVFLLNKDEVYSYFPKNQGKDGKTSATPYAVGRGASVQYAVGYTSYLLRSVGPEPIVIDGNQGDKWVEDTEPRAIRPAIWVTYGAE